MKEVDGRGNSAPQVPSHRLAIVGMALDAVPVLGQVRVVCRDPEEVGVDHDPESHLLRILDEADRPP